MDIQLPGIDGYEATRRIKAIPALRAIPIIVVTSYALSGDDAKARPPAATPMSPNPSAPRPPRQSSRAPRLGLDAGGIRVAALT